MTARKPLVSELRTGPFCYAVQAVRDMRDNEDKEGSCDPTTLTIRYDASLPVGRALVTLVHESLHALIDQVSIGSDLPDEEAVVDALAPAVAQWVHDNPQLMQLLMYQGVDA